VRTKVVEYLMELGVPVRERTPFEKVPCYLCRNYDPWIERTPLVSDNTLYDEETKIHPCDFRQRYCRTFERLCKHYEEAGKTFWSAERWRSRNKTGYVFMNHNLWRYHSSGGKANADN